jgi:hypothetical protein
MAVTPKRSRVRSPIVQQGERNGASQRRTARGVRAVSIDPDDPRCPECGGKIGQTATYCMHCSADLTEERAAADRDADGTWDQAEAGVSSPQPADPTLSADDFGELLGGDGSGGESGGLLAADGFVDDTLTVVVGILGGLVVGVVGTFVLATVTASGWSLAFGAAAWLVATAYLVRRSTVQAAISKGAYAVAGVLLLVPIVALSPVVSVDGGVEARGGLFFVLFVFVAAPALVAAAIGWVASRFVPENADGTRR